MAKEEKVRPTMMRLGRSPIVVHSEQFKARDYLANCFHLTEKARGSRCMRRAVASKFAEDLVGQMCRENGILSPHLAGNRR